MKRDYLVIFIAGLKTFKFVDVRELEINDKTINFKYYSQSQHVERKATFYLNKISGYSMNNHN